MGASVGVGALIMGVTLLSIFAIASAMLTEHIEVALEITEPEVIAQPELEITDATNSGIIDSLTFTPNQGTAYFPGDLSFSAVCDTPPTGTYTVTSEVFVIDLVDESGNYNDTSSPDGEYFTFQELQASIPGNTDEWYVWFSVNPDLGGSFGTSTDTDPAPAGISNGIEVNINEGDVDTAIRTTVLGELTANGPASITWDIAGLANHQIRATYANSGPVDNWNSGDSPVTLASLSNGGVIDGTNLATSGAGCTSTPDVDTQFPGDSNEDITAIMQWDLTFKLTNDGEETLNLDEIFVSLDGGTTAAISSTPAFTSEYLFPGETVTVIYDQNAANSHNRIAVMSHGAMVAVDL